MTKTFVTAALIAALAGPALAGSNLLTSHRAEDLTLTDASGDPVGFLGQIAPLKDASGALDGLLHYFDSAYDGNGNVVGHTLNVHNADGTYRHTLLTDTSPGVAQGIAVNGSDYYLYRPEASNYDSQYVIEKVVSDGTGYGLQQVGRASHLNTIDFNPVTGEAYATYDPVGFWSDNTVARLDLSGADQHADVAYIGGASGGLAFDEAGNLFVGTVYYVGANKVLKYEAAEIADVLAGGGLLGADANHTLTETPVGVSRMDVDAAGNVVFGLNGFSGPNLLAGLYAGETYDAANPYEQLSSAYGYVGTVFATGDVRAYQLGDVDNAAFGVGYGGPIAYVPEPASAAVLALAGLGAALGRRRSPAGK